MFSKLLTFDDVSLIIYANGGGNDSTDSQLDWLRNTLYDASEAGTQSIFLFTAKPFINPYFDQKADIRGKDALNILKGYPVKEVISGNTHIFSRYIDDATGMTITTVGASGSYKNPLPQFIVLDIYSTGDHDITAYPGIDVESVD